MAALLTLPLVLAGPAAWGGGRGKGAGDAAVDAGLSFGPSSNVSAARLKARANDAMDAGAFGAALRDYREAYALTHDRALLYNMGRACQKLGNYQEALGYLERFDQVASPTLRARVPKLRQLIAEVRARLARVRVTSNVVGARVLIRGTWVGVTPLRGPAPTALPGAASIEVIADGYLPFKRELVLVAGREANVTATLIPAPPTMTLTVRSSSRGANVCIDSRCLGPPPVVAPLEAGIHTVVLQRRDGEPIRTTTALARGESKELLLEPVAPPAAITSRWWFWTGVGAVVAGSVALTAALLSNAGSGTAGGTNGAPAVPAGQR